MTQPDPVSATVSNPEIVELVRNKIEQMRKKLLDFTRRNALIHMKIDSDSRAIRVIDELPDILRYELLEGKRLKLKPLPEISGHPPDEQNKEFSTMLANYKNFPHVQERIVSEEQSGGQALHHSMTVERHIRDELRQALGLPERQPSGRFLAADNAKMHGFNPSFELPLPENQHSDGRHTDDQIQTLLYLDSLNTRGKALFDRHRTIERETGVGALQAVFGLLEWKPPGENRSYLSPITLLDVQIERKNTSLGPVFSVFGGDTLQTNPALTVKLNSEHGLELAAYETGSIETYFQAIQASAPLGWGWKVRREVVFCLLPSPSLAMYRDLDTAQRDVARHPNVCKLLASTGTATNTYAEVYSTDDPAVSKSVPLLVKDADSSQYAALVDVANGKNLAIEGPPGTGKSQTIVNMIASAMAAGKKVLFVAEKLTALEVVSARMAEAGLAPFVLPLQADKHSRERVYESLRERVNLKRIPDTAHEKLREKREVLDRCKAQLQGYLDILRRPFGHTKMTVYTIFGHAIANASKWERLPRSLRRLPIEGIEYLTSTRINQLKEQGDQLGIQLLENRDLPEFWQETGVELVSKERAEDTGHDLSALVADVRSILKEGHSEPFDRLFEPDPLCIDAHAFVYVLELISRSAAKNYPRALLYCLSVENRKNIQAVLEQYEARERHKIALSKLVNNPLQPDLGQLLHKAAVCFEDFGHLDRTNAEQEREQLRRKELADTKLLEHLEQLPKELTAVLSLKDLQTLAAKAANIDLELLNRTSLSMGDFAGAVHAVEQQIKALNRMEADLKKTVPGADGVTEEEVKQHAEALYNRGALSYFSAPVTKAKRFCQRVLKVSTNDLDEMAEALFNCANFLNKIAAFERYAPLQAALGPLFQGRQTDLALLKKIQHQHKLLAEISSDIWIKNWVKKTGGKPLRPVLHADLSGLETLEDLKNRLRLNQADGKQVDQQLSLIDHVSPIFVEECVSAQIITEALRLHELHAAVDREISQSALSERLGYDKEALQTETAFLRDLCATGEALSNIRGHEGLLHAIQHQELEKLRQTLEQFCTRRDQVESRAVDLLNELKIETEENPLIYIANRAHQIEKAASKPEGLVVWSKLSRNRKVYDDGGLKPLLEWFLENCANGPSLGDLTLALIYKNMAEQIRESNKEVFEGYTGEDFNQIRKQIADIDRDLIELSQQAVKARILLDAKPPHGQSEGRKSSFTESALIHHELQKKKGRIAVRQLTRRAGKALLELKPCWMMSPLAVARYLDNLTFDLLIIDEASQMTPEAAIGAVSRAKQLVVVGDTKQLPPTNFFKLTLDESAVDEDEVEERESVLELANTCFAPVRQLRWHYRSRHSALIEFSNHWLYDDNLTIFPSANENDVKSGVRLHAVKGTYKSGKNVKEAEAVVERAIEIMRQEPERSLGIATMNAYQRDLIMEILDLRRDKDAKLREYESAWEKKNAGIEEFFIRSLETVQGDERDIILISTVYGPEIEGGPVAQRFGPINSKEGHRRLNVLFTRAKYRVETFTSLNAADVRVDGSSHQGVRVFKGWLEYAKTGRVPSAQLAGSGSDSPFERHVAEAIKKMGFGVVSQVGVSGFRIDLGIEHPDWPHGYLMGVECDGASYHSSRSARDRDRLRQEILESHGWQLHRIWSTDWFNDQRAEVQRLENVLTKRLKSLTGSTMRRQTPIKVVEPVQKPVPKPVPLSAGFDEMILPSFPYEIVTSFVPSGLQEASSTGLTAPKVVSQVVELGKTVEVKKLFDDRGRMKFTLTKGDEADPDNGMVGNSSPIGAAIMGAREDEEIEYQVGAYIRTIKILKVT